MKKCRKVILNLLTFGVFHITFYLCNVFPNRIHNFSSSLPIIEVLLNILFFLVYNYLLIVVFVMNKTVVSDGIFGSLNAIWTSVKSFKYWALLFLRLALIGITLCLEALLSQWAYLGAYLLEILFWLVLYILLVDKKSVNLKQRKNIFVCALVVLIVVSICVALDFFQLSALFMLEHKYMETSPYLTQIRSNFEFLHTFKLTLVDFTIICALTIFHIYTTKEQLCEERKTGKEPFKYFLRFDLVIAFVAALSVMRCVILPNSFGPIVDISSFGGEIHYVENSAFDERRERIRFLRSDMKSQSSIRVCYYTESAQLKKGDTKSERIDITDKNTEYLFNNKKLERATDSKAYEIDDVMIYLYRTKAIHFYEDTPRVVLLKDLHSFEEKEVVINLLEQLISEGNVFAFEYGCEYLLKYDNAFIEPYITRYADGDFTNSEHQWMEASHYHSEYIINLAKDNMGQFR